MPNIVNRVLVIVVILSFVASVCGLYFVIKNTNTSEGASSKIISDNLLTSSSSPDVNTNMYVYISGAVKHPGIYPINIGSRVGEIISSAGGIAAGADLIYITKKINLAAKTKDEQFIYIPWTSSENSNISISEQPDMTNNVSSTAPEVLQPKLNLNTSSREALLDLKGVGSAYADKIIAARPIKSFDDLINIAKLPKTLVTSLSALTTL